MKNKVILIISFLIVFIGYSGWELLQSILENYIVKVKAEEVASQFFFICVELGFVGYTYLITEQIKDKTCLFYKMSKFVFMTTIMTVVDRLFFDPYSVTKYDYILLSFNLFITFDGGQKIRTIGDKIRKVRENLR